MENCDFSLKVIDSLLGHCYSIDYSLKDTFFKKTSSYVVQAGLKLYIAQAALEFTVSLLLSLPRAGITSVHRVPSPLLFPIALIAS